MAFVRFAKAKDVAGEQLHWGRADLDRAPFRGPTIPLLKTEEIERKLERSRDVLCGTFDTTKPEMLQHTRTYRDVLEGCANNWFELIVKLEKWWDRGPNETPVMLVYIEWSEPYMIATDAAQANNSNFIQVQ